VAFGLFIYGLSGLTGPRTAVRGNAIAAVLMRHTRSAMLQVLGADYVRTARSKGLKESAVVLKHALRNSIIPVVTYIGIGFGTLLGGAIVTEVIFNWDGVGQALVTAIGAQDNPIVLGAVTVVTVALSLISAPVFSAIASAHGESMPVWDSLQYGLAALFSNLVYATVAFALALVTRSMAGGMALALVFAFVIDNLLSAIPVVGDYALSAAVIELMSQISGAKLGNVGDGDPNVLRALAVTAAWMIALVGVSVTRFTRSDVE